MEYFRDTARGVDPSLELKLWVEGAVTPYETRGNVFMQAMVRREMRVLQHGIVNIPRSKMDEIRHALHGNQSGDSGPRQDEIVEMYI